MHVKFLKILTKIGKDELMILTIHKYYCIYYDFCGRHWYKKKDKKKHMFL